MSKQPKFLDQSGNEADVREIRYNNKGGIESLLVSDGKHTTWRHAKDFKQVDAEKPKQPETQTKNTKLDDGETITK